MNSIATHAQAGVTDRGYDTPKVTPLVHRVNDLEERVEYLSNFIDEQRHQITTLSEQVGYLENHTGGSLY